VIEDSGSNLSIVVGPKYSLFHVVEPLTVKFDGFINNHTPEAFEHLINGLYVMPLHLLEQQNPRMLIAQVIGLGGAASQAQFEREDGTMISVADYYAQKYNPLARPDAPVVICRQGGRRDIMYPLEICVVCDNVRLTTENAGAEDYITRLIRVSSAFCAHHSRFLACRRFAEHLATKG
jgi:hypothetical protein